MRIANKLLYLAALVATFVGLAVCQSAWKVGTSYKAGQTVTYQGATYKVLVNHKAQADWYPGCCDVLWQVASTSQGGSAAASQSAVTVSAPTTGWPARVFAPYVDILLWPTLDITKVAAATGVKHYTLAFLISDANNNPAWGGMTPLDQGFYADYINGIRKLGGDVIISFGGANGQEIALTNTNVATLQSKYESVIVKYDATAVDFDIEGGAVLDTASIDRRNKAIAGFQKKYPNIRTSYTLPVMPTGLMAEGVAILSSAKRNGARIDVVNLMTMDYGPGAAPQGSTMMGSYAISAAQATYKQAVAALGSSVKIGVCPMIGQNDVAGEVFRIADSVQVTNWALSTSWMSHLAMWSINRDTATTGPLYASSQIPQKDYDFAKNFVKYTSPGATAPITSTKPTATTSSAKATTSSGATYVVGSLPKMVRIAVRGVDAVGGVVEDTVDVTGIVGSASSSLPDWKDRTFAPYVDLTVTPPYNFHSVGEQYGVRHYTLAFVSADGNGNPTWGGEFPIPIQTAGADQILDRINYLRSRGGDVIIAFSSATSSSGAELHELAQQITDVTDLQNVYQAVIDKYQATWIDFVLHEDLLDDAESVSRRNQAVAGLKKANANLKVGFTVPVEEKGLSESTKKVLEAAKEAGLHLDILNLMTLDLPAPLPVLQTITTSALGAYQYLQTNLPTARVGLTPWIGKNPDTDETFTLQNAFQLAQWAKNAPFVGQIGYWSVNRDHEGDVDAGGSGVPQGPLGFAQALAIFDD